MDPCHECKMHFLAFDNSRETFFKRFLNVYIIDSTLKRALLLIKIISFGMKTHGYYTKCNTNVRREVNPRWRWRRWYSGREDTMHIHPREWSVMRQESGDRACAATLAWEAPCLTGGFSPAREKRGTVPRESFQGSPGVEKGWNGMEWSRA